MGNLLVPPSIPNRPQQASSNSRRTSGRLAGPGKDLGNSKTGSSRPDKVRAKKNRPPGSLSKVSSRR